MTMHRFPKPHGAKPHGAPSEPVIPAFLHDLQSVVIAVMSRSGTLIEANRAFVELLPQETPAEELRDIRSVFMNPRFDQLAARRARGPDGIVFGGRLQIGDPGGIATTLVGTIYEHGPDLLVVAERNVAELERLADLVLKLNEDLADNKRELLRMGRKVDTHERAARQVMSDREVLLNVLENDERRLPDADRPVSQESARSEARRTREPLRWDDDLGTGITSLDAEHAQMIDHYNALIDAIDTGKDTAAVRHELQALMHCTRRHFEHEERVMENIGLPDWRAHAQEHERLLKDAEDFIRNIGNGFRREDCPAVARYFEYWILRHGREWDAEIRKFVERTPD